MAHDHAAEPNRRRFLLSVSTAALAASAVGAAQGCSGYHPPADGGTDDAATNDGNGGGVGTSTGLTVADLPVGMTRAFNRMNPAFMVGRDESGFFALSLICTHQGCQLMVGSAALNCPCHASAYDFSGTVTQLNNQGGAQPPLPGHPVSFTGTGDTAEILVDTGTTVAGSTRTPPPA